MGYVEHNITRERREDILNCGLYPVLYHKSVRDYFWLRAKHNVSTKVICQSSFFFFFFFFFLSLSLGKCQGWSYRVWDLRFSRS